MAFFLSLFGLIVVLFIACRLWRRDPWPRIEGDAPHCRRCKYCLTGLREDTMRCPECASELTPQNITAGRISRSKLSIVLAVVLLCVSVLVTAHFGHRFVREAEYYRFMPFGWVLERAKLATSPPTGPFPASWAQLLERVQAEELEAGQLREIATEGLRRQATFKSAKDLELRINEWGWIVLLDTLRDGGLLTPTETLQYHQQALGVEFAVRPRVLEGAPIPMWISAFKKTGNLVYSFSQQECHVHIETEAIVAQGTAVAPAAPLKILREIRHHTWEPYGSPKSLTVSSEGLAPGTYDVTVRLVRRFCIDESSCSQPGHQHEQQMPIRLSRQLEVLPSAMQTSVKMTQDPRCRKSMEQNIVLRAIEWSPGRTYAVDLGIAGPISCDIAVNLFVVVDGVECGPRQFLHSGPHSLQLNGYRFSDIKGAPPTNAKEAWVVLRPNPSAAEESVNVIETYDGEVKLGPVPVSIAKSSLEN